jgi:excinuclease ABC subunit B
MGRAARHLHGKAVLYADVMTDSMRQAIGETDRRRRIQVQYNEENHITPQSIVKPIDMTLVAIAEADYVTVPLEEEDQSEVPPEQLERVIGELEQKMREAAKKFEFEKAAQVRDRVKALKARLVSVG